MSNHLSYKKIKFILLQIAWLTFVVKVPAQPIGYLSEFYSLKEGLSNRLVTEFQYINPGYLWLGTQDGLNKFDGYTFTIFDDQADNPNQISGNYIDKLLKHHTEKLFNPSCVPSHR
ncbi:MAG: hypothetical protein AAFO07_21650 [Bacteroidota bacterium]